MGIRTVRLDEETAKALEQIVTATGLSVSGALKKGLLVLRPSGHSPETPAVILVDTGPFVALFDPKDASHRRCRDVLKTFREPLVTSSRAEAQRSGPSMRQTCNERSR